MCLSVAGPLPLIHGGVLCEVGGPSDAMAHQLKMAEPAELSHFEPS